MQAALIFALLLLFAAAPVRGGAGEPPELAAALKRIGECRTVAAKFPQTRRLKDLDMEIVIRGSMASEKNGRLLWRVDDPVPSVTLITGKKLVHRDEATGKVSELAADRPWLKLLRDSFIDCLSGDVEKLRRSFEVGTVPPDKLRLTPLTPELKKLYAAVELVVDLKRDVLSALILDEPSGDRMTIRFEEVRRNPELPESLWRIPPGR